MREGWKRNSTSIVHKCLHILGEPSDSVCRSYQDLEKLQKSCQLWFARGVKEKHLSEQGIRSTEHRPTGSKPIEHGNARSSFIGLMLARSCRAGPGLWGGYPWGGRGTILISIFFILYYSVSNILKILPILNNGWDVNNRWLSCWGDCYWSFNTIIEL